MTRGTLTICFALSLSSFAVPVFAQSDEGASSLAVAGGYARALHGDLDYAAPMFLTSWRRLVTGAFAIEPEFGSWFHSETQRLGASVPGGPEVTVRDTRTAWNIGVNFLGVAPVRAVRPFAGGGLGVYWEGTSHRVNDGGTQTTMLSRTNGPRLGLQGIAGVDVPVSDQVDLFGAFRIEMRSFEDPGGGLGLQGLAGVRFRLR